MPHIELDEETAARLRELAEAEGVSEAEMLKRVMERFPGDSGSGVAR